ncbi:hypothetical protein M378DRAFT_186832 [Amanita muscaria Koide BX008]|uniref:RNI-like protein n=1 Tax=Amanita muscaria (strain Koide BX008) TaxID=946122 RepID=A0A0C2WR12_AMAMK|nr:hypothetical protein M378DRAFT_186832 [Amanita muscaria Koide BX008]
MPLSRGERVQQIDSELYSAQGANAVILTIASRRVVKKLILGHIELGDSGCVILFQFLSSETGRRYEINEIRLNSNRIGDLGLAAIATYLSGNQALRELFLQNNDFTGDPNIAKILAAAVNASHLEVLSLTSNHQRSDAFIEGFLQTLMSNHLRELHIGTMNLTPRSLPTIVDYLSSKRCKLSVLQCNGNFLGLRGIKSIIRAVEQHNYSLTSLGLSSDLKRDEDDEDLHGRSTMDVRNDCKLAIKQILARNEQLGRETQRQALKLLLCARTVLLHTQANASTEKRTSICAPSGGRLDDATMSDNTSSFPFLQLPLEIQFHILSFLSPVLSVRQCAEIYRYAATPATLPSLLPRLVGSTTDRRGTSQDVAMLYRGRCGGQQQQQQQHDSSRAREKYQWLAKVNCMVYEPRG